ncbi:hypothetical protein EIK77_009502 [Talaromyces pinophilus]|nr:hypothetical protein EIK77_009502 [Talaromyces pinophilus]
MLPSRNEKVKRKQPKDSQIDDLQRNTSDDDIVSGLEGLCVDRCLVGGGCINATADSLQAKTKDVEGDKDPGVESRRDARKVWADCARNVFEGEIDTSADEGWCKDDANEV